MKNWEEEQKEAIELLNKELQTLVTFEDFQNFMKKLDSYEMGLGLEGKRRGYKAFGFFHMYDKKQSNGDPYYFTGHEKYKDRIHYLYSDGVSTGESHVKNLHRALRVHG